MDPKPPPADLLDAIAAWMLDEIVPALQEDRGRAFRARVAANLLAIAAREVRDEGAVSAALHAESSALLGCDPASAAPAEVQGELAARLRSTAAGDPFSQQARRMLMGALEARLALSNPRFRVGLKLEREEPAP